MKQTKVAKEGIKIPKDYIWVKKDIQSLKSIKRTRLALVWTKSRSKTVDLCFGTFSDKKKSQSGIQILDFSTFSTETL